MEPPASHSIPKRLLSVVLPLLLIGGVLLLCYYPIRYIVLVAGAPWVAQNLAPPPYPNTILLTDRQFARGTTGFVMQRTYYTPDSPDQVFLYMTEYMETIETIESEETGDGYYGVREDTRWMGQQLAETGCTLRDCRTTQAYSYPRFTLYFYPAPDDSIGTRIEYEFTYPTP